MDVPLRFPFRPTNFGLFIYLFIHISFATNHNTSAGTFERLSISSLSQAVQTLREHHSRSINISTFQAVLKQDADTNQQDSSMTTYGSDYKSVRK